MGFSLAILNESATPAASEKVEKRVSGFGRKGGKEEKERWPKLAISILQEGDKYFRRKATLRVPLILHFKAVTNARLLSLTAVTLNIT